MSSAAIFPLLCYDGHCALCAGSVQVLLKLDDEGLFHYAPLQSELAEGLLKQHGIDRKLIDSIVVIDQSGAYTKSDAFFHICGLLGWPYRVLKALRVIPVAWRDAIYDWVARNRYRVFGTHESCWMPQAGWKDRFLGEGG